MIDQNVQVLRCRDGRVQVRLGPTTGCAACDIGVGCGAGVFARLLRPQPATVEVDRGRHNFAPGQMATLSIPEHIYLQMVMAYYGWPLLVALLAAVLANNLAAAMLRAGPGLLDAVTLVAGLLAGGTVLYAIKKRNISAYMTKSLKIAVCYPAKNPNMCSSEAYSMRQE